MMLTIKCVAPNEWQVLDEAGEAQSIGTTVFDKAGTPISILKRTWPTMQAAEAALAARLEWTYYTSVKAWLKSLRACPTCATLMAYAKVEHWAGRPGYAWKAARGECTGVACGACPRCMDDRDTLSPSCPHPLNCETLATQNAKTQPQPPCDHPNNPKPAAKKEKSHGPNTRTTSATPSAAATA